MCGIVGLHLRTPDLYPRLGELLTGMLGEMQERGADSAGVAVYGDPRWSPAGSSTVSLLGAAMGAHDLGDAVGRALAAHSLETDVRVVAAGDVLLVSAPVPAERLRAAVAATSPEALIIGYGTELAVLKGVGQPKALAESFGLSSAQGWQGVGHTRMATESAVTPAGSHPYAVGPDQCLLHNGSFSNHATIRRELMREGVRFDSENDTEVGAHFIARCLDLGMDVETSLKELCRRFDGFFTLLVSNKDSFAVVRDAIACKPAVIAETDDWVAMGSEYRALAALPGIESARIYEPEPMRVYAWNR